jgi:hypothetical protein
MHRPKSPRISVKTVLATLTFIGRPIRACHEPLPGRLRPRDAAACPPLQAWPLLRSGFGERVELDLRPCRRRPGYRADAYQEHRIEVHDAVVRCGDRRDLRHAQALVPAQTEPPPHIHHAEDETFILLERRVGSSCWRRCAPEQCDLHAAAHFASFQQCWRQARACCRGAVSQRLRDGPFP